MGKYTGSPWGGIRGKLDDIVGGAWKGIKWCRVLVSPTQRGTLLLYKKMKAGEIPPERFSFPQFNLRRCCLQILGWIATREGRLTNWMYPVWQDLCKRRNYRMTGVNLFTQRNAANFFASMNREIEFDPTTNTPDLKKILMSDGDLEETPILTAVYTTGTGDLVVTWDDKVFKNGLANDRAFVMVARKPLHDSIGEFGNWEPALEIYGSVIPPEPAVSIPRSTKAFTLTIPTGLTVTDLTAYLLFRDALNIYGYSPSTSAVVTAL